MKKFLLYIILLFACTGNLFSQSFSPSETYTYSRVYLDSVTVGSSNLGTAQSQQIVQYSDGLGAIKQSISINAIKPNQDIVASYFYDADGKQTKQYLPVSAATQGGLLQSVSEATINSYYGTSNAYSEVEYDNSPLNRVMKKASPGDDWAITSGHTQDMTYEFNEGNTVKKYSATLNTTTFINTFNDNGFYAIKTLFKTSVKDEDGNISSEYKNTLGRVVMSRVKNGRTSLDTYYVYNQYNQLAYIVPPLNNGENPTDAATADNILYQYTYDALGRVTEKKLPGKGKEYYVYDRENRLVMSTDTNLKSQGRWSFVKYDKMGRVVYTGLCSAGERADVQISVDNSANLAETRTSSIGFTNFTFPVYYTKTVYPTTITDVLSINYYDEYPAATDLTIPTSIYSQPVLSSDVLNSSHSTKSLPTASFVRNIENKNWNRTFFWYDTKERMIGSHKINDLGGTTSTEMQLDFPGNITESKVYHRRLSTDTDVIVKQRYVYSKQNLLLSHYHQVDSEPEEVLERFTYDDLGRVVNKQVGNNLQSIDYTYNIRGWMTGINNPSNLQGKLFGLSINYNGSLQGVSKPYMENQNLEVKKRYNGNIAEISWNTATASNPNNELKTYGYVYDSSNRLLGGFYEPDNNKYSQEHSEALDYDNRGNIRHLKRTSALVGTTATVIDSLTYSYNGNQLQSVADESGNPAGYEGGGSTIDYDDNGNMTSMPDKGISTIDYNLLNLPDHMEVTPAFGVVTTIDYRYGADGTKLLKTTTTTTTRFRGTPTTVVNTQEYLDGFQYIRTETSGEDLNGDAPVNDLSVAMEEEAFIAKQPSKPVDPPVTNPPATLQFFPTSEGFYDYLNKKYIYQYKDQLGNVRVSYAKNETDGIDVLDENNYYALGMNHLRPDYASYFGDGGFEDYKYNGKQLQETGMYDYGWRQYMPDIGRWNAMDQFSENYNSTSPYAYVMNNPVMMYDPDGRVTKDFFNSFWNGTASGTNSYWTNTGSSFVGGEEGQDQMEIGYNGGFMSLNSNYSDGGLGMHIINIPEVNIIGNNISNSGNQIQNSFNSYMDIWNINNSTSMGFLNNASEATTYTGVGTGATFGLANDVSESLISSGRMIKAANPFKFYNLYRVNGALNGNQYISGSKFLSGAETLGRYSKYLPLISFVGVGIGTIQTIESRNPAYFTRSWVSMMASFIPYGGPIVSFGIDKSNVNLWNIYTLTERIQYQGYKTPYNFIYDE